MPIHTVVRLAPSMWPAMVSVMIPMPADTAMAFAKVKIGLPWHAIADEDGRVGGCKSAKFDRRHRLGGHLRVVGE